MPPRVQSEVERVLSGAARRPLDGKLNGDAVASSTGRPVVSRPVKRLYCENGDHEWERAALGGRNPRNCPEHKGKPSPYSGFKAIYCQEGDHEWGWPVKRGRQPFSCPEHWAPKDTRRRYAEVPKLSTKPDSKAYRCQQALLNRINEHRNDGSIPTSNHFLYYEITGRGILPKGKRTEAELTRQCMNLRLMGLIDWDEITDDTRKVESFEGYDTFTEGVQNALRWIKLNPWVGSPWGDEPPLVLTESRSLSGVLEPPTAKYRAIISSVNGQCGGHLHTKLASVLEVPRPVLFLGDLDWHGGSIEDNARGVLEDIVGPLDWKRIAITKKQTKNIKPIRKNGEDTYETEMLGQTTLVKLLERELKKLLPQPLAEIEECEEDERASFLELAQGFREAA
ncbi:MAG: hypothetical protein ACHQC8_01610 [Solirubrobacterales bacterium]